MASSSSSSASPPNLKWTYDVFLSFRGEDTRNNFVDHLFMNLTQKGINTFRDNERLERGKEISPELLKAIEESRFAIIIFSENYASSSWCLDELVKIIDCTKETRQIAYPIFYNVDPSNVRKQEGSFAKAFDEHKKKNLALEKMEKWKEALSRAGRIAGWDTRNRPEAKIIQEIVEKILYMLSRALLHVDDNLVGMEIHMKEINTLLDTGVVWLAESSWKGKQDYPPSCFPLFVSRNGQESFFPRNPSCPLNPPSCFPPHMGRNQNPFPGILSK